MKLPTLTIALVLAGCASKPAPPSWQPNAKDALDGFTDDYLRGNTAARERRVCAGAARDQPAPGASTWWRRWSWCAARRGRHR
jgi:hypothetical protein